MGFAASWDFTKGTDVGQTAEQIPDDRSVQSDSTQQYWPCIQEGILNLYC